MTGNPDRRPLTDAEVVREFCAEADDPMALVDTMGLGAVGAAVEARRELARRLAAAEEARREASRRAIERARGAFSDMRERLGDDQPAEAPKTKKRLAAMHRPMWLAPGPEVRYEFCPVESLDGMLDLPPVRLAGEEESDDGEA